MKLSCIALKKYLIPYSNGTLVTERPSLFERVSRHIEYCAECRAEATRLESNDAILQGYASRARTTRERQADLAGTAMVRGKVMTPLSSRVLAAIQSDEKLYMSNRWSPTGLSFATAALGVVLVASLINPQSGALAWILRHTQTQKPAPNFVVHKPAFPTMDPLPSHDPMGGASSLGAGFTYEPFGGSGGGADVNTPSATMPRHAALPSLRTPRIATYGTDSGFKSPSIRESGANSDLTISNDAPPQTHTIAAYTPNQTNALGETQGSSASDLDATSAPSIGTVPDGSENQAGHGAIVDYAVKGIQGETADKPLDPTVSANSPTPPGPPGLAPSHATSPQACRPPCPPNLRGGSAKATAGR